MNTLEIVGQFPDRFEIKALCAKTSVDRLAEQVHRFNPDIAVVYDQEHAEKLNGLVGGKTKILFGESAYSEAVQLASVDIVVSAMVGAAGLLPTLAAIDAGKDIALANKETLVMAGDIVMKKAGEKGVVIFPVDSEHSAIFQCLEGNRGEDYEKIYLTASGGPFLHHPSSDFGCITPKDALKHPNWEMGKKISIDSATLMNKGLEVIEAAHLFGVPVNNIQVVVHPQSIVHSMVGYRDGSVIAQLSLPDMKGAIAYALSYPERLPIEMAALDFFELGQLTFFPPDTKKFPCLDLALKACYNGGTFPAVMNAANEIAVEAFLAETISFLQLPEIIRLTMDAHRNILSPQLSDIMAADRWARTTARAIADEFSKNRR